MLVMKWLAQQYSFNKAESTKAKQFFKETPRDYYANDAVWKAVYQKGEIEPQEAMDLAYLTGQRPADVRLMRVDDKAASEILDLDDASRLLGHSKQETTTKIYVRVGAIANPTK